MGTEYYLIKPEKKEVFYLGKHFNGFNEISSATYHSITEAEFPNYEDWDDFFWDVLKENWDYFLGCDLTLEQTSDVIHQVYEWCRTDRVILDNDCSTSCEEWKDWKETGSITDILQSIHRSALLNSAENKALQDYMEEQESIVFKNPSYDASIIGVTTDGRAVYDYYAMVEELASEDNIALEEAEEFIQYNTIGSLPQPETKYPIILFKKEDII